MHSALMAVTAWYRLLARVLMDGDVSCGFVHADTTAISARCQQLPLGSPRKCSHASSACLADCLFEVIYLKLCIVAICCTQVKTPASVDSVGPDHTMIAPNDDNLL